MSNASIANSVIIQFLINLNVALLRTFCEMRNFQIFCLELSIILTILNTLVVVCGSCMCSSKRDLIDLVLQDDKTNTFIIKDHEYVVTSVQRQYKGNNAFYKLCK